MMVHLAATLPIARIVICIDPDFAAEAGITKFPSLVFFKVKKLFIIFLCM